MADYQKSKVYAWERAYLPNDSVNIDIKQARTLVDYIWEDMGLKYPPVVTEFNSKRYLGTASRLQIHLLPLVSTITIIHEISHSLTAEIDGMSCGHGPSFVGMYVKLLDKYAGVPLPQSMALLKRARVDFDINIQPVFID